MCDTALHWLAYQCGTWYARCWCMIVVALSYTYGTLLRWVAVTQRLNHHTRKMKKAYPWLLPNPQYWRYLHRVVRWQEETWQGISHPGWTFPAWVAACLLIMAMLTYQNIGAKNTVNSVMYWRYGKFCHGWTSNAILGVGRRKHNSSFSLLRNWRCNQVPIGIG